MKEHIESHFLSLDKYGKLYEKRIVENSQKETAKCDIRENCAEKKHDINNTNNLQNQKDPLCEKLIDESLPATSTNQSVNIQIKSNVELTKEILENELQTTSKPAKITQHRASGDSLGTIGSGSENEDVYVYLCPFPDCEFTTDFQVNK